jgi:TRAP-type C4-dicarboxylate transport system substrate-binding protein
MPIVRELWLRVFAAILAALLAVTAAGCSGAKHTKAGARAVGHVTVLRLENANADTGPLGLYTAEVSRLSGGSLRIEIGRRAHYGDPAAEQAVIRDVRAGKGQLAWVGSRVWDVAGVDSFQALVAPFLIDSYPLEQKVLQSEIPGRMLESLRPLGLVGIGVLPGPIRRMLGVRKPFLEVDDFAGTRVGIGFGEVAEATVRALGATPIPQPTDAKLTGLDGFEHHLGSIVGNQYYRVSKGVTTNVRFWPRPLVLFANRRLFSSLSASQRTILLRAARNVLPSFTQAAASDDRDAVDQLCRSGFDFDLLAASRGDLAGLHRRVRPVYRQLERDPQTRRFIQTITAMKRGERPEPPPRCPGSKQSTAARAGGAQIDGVYQMTTSASADGAAENWGKWIFVFDRGRLAFTQENGEACTWAYGKVTVSGNSMTWTIVDGGYTKAPNRAYNKPGEFFKFGWSLYRDTLTLAPVEGASSPDNFRAKPWHRISTTSSRRYFSKHCPPPVAALPR